MEKEDIKYLVLSALGYVEKPDFVQSDDNAVRIVNDQYEHYLSLAIASNQWNFFIARKGLEREDAEGKYRYKYELPEDMEILNNPYSDDKYSYVISDFETVGGYLYTNSQKCYIEYRRKVCEDMLAPYFVEFFRLYMAYNLCMLVTGDSNLEQSLHLRWMDALNQARALDYAQKATRILDTGVYTGVRNY